MTVYYHISYDITDPEEFNHYGPALLPLLKRYNAEVLASDTAGIPIEGTPKTMQAIVKFPSEEAALACYNDPEYQPIKAIRHRSTKNCTMVLIKHFTGAGNQST